MVKKTWKRNEEAVSPVVATLLLVLVTVSAAVGFYVWQAEWQADTSNQLSDVNTKTPITIAGSTTVYEFSTVGASMFEAEYLQYQVSVQKGGSGAGKISAAQGIVDIGSSSSALSSTDTTTYPNLVQTLVAYDAIVLVVPSATTNTHGLVSMNETVLKAIYYKNGGATYTAPTWMPTGGDGIYQWNEIPATQGVVFNASNTCTGTQTVKIYDRADHSGTEESFSKQMADTGKDTLEEAGITTGNSYPSNQEIITKLAADNDGFGFMAYGLAKQSTNGLRMIPFAGDQGLVDPNSSSTFVSKVKVGNAAGGYDGARGLYYLTDGAPTGAAKLYIDYVKTPDVNNAICNTAGYISLYA
jgi:phosphate transport system substrate-binding protein